MYLNAIKLIDLTGFTLFKSFKAKYYANLSGGPMVNSSSLFQNQVLDATNIEMSQIFHTDDGETLCTRKCTTYV
jgi:hypothetical protein